MTNGPKYPDITAEIIGGDGNVFAIIGTVTKAMRRGGVPTAEVQAFREQAMSQHSYDEVLALVMETVEVA